MKATNNTFNLSGITPNVSIQPPSVAEETPKSGMSFYDLYSDNRAFENMVSRSEAHNYYDEGSSNLDEFINNTEAVGVSEFGAEPSADELARIQSALNNSETYAKEGGLEAKDADAIRRSYSPQEQTIIHYSNQVNDPLINSIATFIQQPTSANFSAMVNQVSAVINEWTQDKTAQATETITDEHSMEATQEESSYTTAKDGVMYDDRGFAVNSDVVNAQSDRRKPKEKASKYADIPDAIEENYTTGDDNEYGYGYN